MFARMERDRGFNFKLVVPPRVNSGQIHAVQPQEKVDSISDFLKTIPPSHMKCLDKENSLAYVATSVVAPTKASKPEFPKMREVSPLEMVENNCSAGELYSKMLEEVEKIKSWKVKVESDTMQKERKLQESKMTIETQRKAIQELQFGNENLSIKLEEQISENEELRNKNLATRNLCNILKETFQWSAEKMQLFESEREETHHLFMENSENIKKLISAFENLLGQVEADQQEMQKVKESVQQFTELKQKYHLELLEKEQQIEMLTTCLRKKESKLEKVLTDLSETQRRCEQLEGSRGEVVEQAAKLDDLVKTLEEKLEIKTESVEALKRENDRLEATVKELDVEVSKKTGEISSFEMKIQEMKETLSSEMKKREECLSQIEQLKDDIVEQEAKYEILSTKFDDLESEKAVIQKKYESRLSDAEALAASLRKEGEEKAEDLTKQIQRLEEENERLRDEKSATEAKIQKEHENTESVQKEIEEHCNNLLEKISEKENQIKAMEEKIYCIKDETENKNKVQLEFKKKNKLLMKQITTEKARTTELELKISRMTDEIQTLQKLKDEDHQKLAEDLEIKFKCATELKDEVQKLKASAAEARKEKAEVELKCQHKIAEMVSLMEKHKRQYDQMVEEKEAELNERRKKETEAVTHAESQKSELSKQKSEIEQLKKQLKEKAAEMEALLSEQSEQRRKQSSLDTPKSSQPRRKQFGTPNAEAKGSAEATEGASSKKLPLEVPQNMKTPSNRSLYRSRMFNKDFQTPGSDVASIGSSITATSKIKSYRIRTPPDSQNSGWWKKSTIELDPKSDSSDHMDLLTFANASTPSLSAPKCNFFKKIQSPFSLKSPVGSLRSTPSKRLRNAGWTTVTSCDKKRKKKINEKIFA